MSTVKETIEDLSTIIFDRKKRKQYTKELKKEVKKTNKEILKSLSNSPVKKRKKLRLSADPEAWYVHYMYKDCTSEFKFYFFSKRCTDYSRNELLNLYLRKANAIHLTAFPEQGQKFFKSQEELIYELMNLKTKKINQRLSDASGQHILDFIQRYKYSH